MVGSVEEVAVQKALGESLTIVGRAHLLPEALEALAVEEREGGEQVLARGALEQYVGASDFDNHGERVVEGQWLMQAAGDILLG